MPTNSDMRWRLPIGGVDLWRVPLDGDEGPYAAILSAPERDRLERRCGAARRRFAVSHGALRRIVAAYQGCAPEAAGLSTPYGQPPRADGGLRLSLSHCDDLALVAVACVSVGVDVEALAAAEDEDLDDLAELALSELELANYRAVPRSARARCILRSWTRKEACLKARGEGVGDRALAEIDVSTDRFGGLTIIDLDAGPEYVGAVALARSPTHMTWKEFGDDVR